MPVLTDGWRTIQSNHLVPLSGLDFLVGAEQLIIQQTVELEDILAAVESENRYLVKVLDGETLYVASEQSSAVQRLACGSSRAFLITLYDQSRQEAFRLTRGLACTACCFGCCLQEVRVWTHSGHLVGRIKQQWSFLIPSFLVITATGEEVYLIEGPPNAALWGGRKNADFKVLSRDGTIQYGSIRSMWNASISTYNLVVTFPSRDTDRQLKALLLGAGFLMEYMYFETSKKASWCYCCC